MKLAPRLIEVARPNDPDGVVIVLHGGASRRRRMGVSPTQLSVARMAPIAWRIARAGEGRLAVMRLLNSRRGWETQHTPVQDAQWALDELRIRFGRPIPTCLVGHSLGGRAALLAAGAPEVVSAVALAPWVLSSDVFPSIAGKRFLIIHGSRDRIASPERALEVARRMQAEAEVRFVLVQDAKHAMLRHHATFSSLATEFAKETLLEATASTQT